MNFVLVKLAVFLTVCFSLCSNTLSYNLQDLFVKCFCMRLRSMAAVLVLAPFPFLGCILSRCLKFVFPLLCANASLHVVTHTECIINSFDLFPYCDCLPFIINNLERAL